MRYGLAALAILAFAVMRQALFDAFAPWFLFTPPVVVIALFLGTGAGLFATLLSAVSAGYAIRHPDAAGYLSPVQWVASVLFVVTTAGLVGLVAALRRALRDADAPREELARSAASAAEREAFLASILSSSTDCIKVLDLDGNLAFMSEGGQRVMEVSVWIGVEAGPRVETNVARCYHWQNRESGGVPVGADRDPTPVWKTFVC